mgnify:CR=1 FL=1
MTEPLPKNRVISPLGMSALGFAAFLTILNLSPADRTPLLIWASYVFASGLPLVVFAVVADTLPDHQRSPVKSMIIWFLILGSFMILIGLGLCFWEVAPLAGLLFFGVIFGLLVLSLYLTYNPPS